QAGQAEAQGEPAAGADVEVVAAAADRGERARRAEVGVGAAGGIDRHQGRHGAVLDGPQQVLAADPEARAGRAAAVEAALVAAVAAAIAAVEPAQAAVAQPAAPAAVVAAGAGTAGVAAARTAVAVDRDHAGRPAGTGHAVPGRDGTAPGFLRRSWDFAQRRLDGGHALDLE